MCYGLFRDHALLSEGQGYNPLKIGSSKGGYCRFCHHSMSNHFVNNKELVFEEKIVTYDPELLRKEKISKSAEFNQIKINNFSNS